MHLLVAHRLTARTVVGESSLSRCTSAFHSSVVRASQIGKPVNADRVLMFLARVFSLFVRRLSAVVLFGRIGFGERFACISRLLPPLHPLRPLLPFKLAPAFFAAFFVSLDA